jgi:putative ABC transport system substrate-binding protein
MPYVESDKQAQMEVAAFRGELERLGWTDGRNAGIDYRWASNDLARIRSAAKELVGEKCDVILCRATPVTAALLAETKTIPIVFVNVSDPVGSGFVASITRPGGNATGFTNVEASLGGKWVEVLKEINPRMNSVAALFSPRTAPGGGEFYMRMIQTAARSVKIEAVPVPADDEAAIAHGIEMVAKQPDTGLVVLPDTTTNNFRDLIISLAARHRVPAIYPYRFFVAAGGLASYGLDVVAVYRRAASYVDRILKGERPGDLPVQASDKFELAINARTAKALGLVLSPMLLGRADDVIE